MVVGKWCRREEVVLVERKWCVCGEEVLLMERNMERKCVGKRKESSESAG